MSDKETEAVYDLAALAQTYLQRAEAAEALLAQRVAQQEPKVRGYVVLIPNRSEAFEVGATGVLFSDVRQASAEAAWAEEEFGLTGAHVGVVTAMPAPTEEAP